MRMGRARLRILLLVLGLMVVCPNVRGDMVYLPLIYGNWHNRCNTNFTRVGETSRIQGVEGISGKVVVTGNQSLFILDYTQPDVTVQIWLAKREAWYDPVAVVHTLERRAYEHEWVDMTNMVPGRVCCGDADLVVFYAVEWNVIIGAAPFRRFADCSLPQIWGGR